MKIQIEFEDEDMNLGIIKDEIARQFINRTSKDFDGLEEVKRKTREEFEVEKKRAIESMKLEVTSWDKDLAFNQLAAKFLGSKLYTQKIVEELSIDKVFIGKVATEVVKLLK